MDKEQEIQQMKSISKEQLVQDKIDSMRQQQQMDKMDLEEDPIPLHNQIQKQSNNNNHSQKMTDVQGSEQNLKEDVLIKQEHKSPEINRYGFENQDTPAISKSKQHSSSPKSAENKNGINSQINDHQQLSEMAGTNKINQGQQITPTKMTNNLEDDVSPIKKINTPFKEYNQDDNLSKIEQQLNYNEINHSIGVQQVNQKFNSEEKNSSYLRDVKSTNTVDKSNNDNINPSFNHQQIQMLNDKNKNNFDDKSKPEIRKNSQENSSNTEENQRNSSNTENKPNSDRINSYVSDQQYISPIKDQNRSNVDQKLLDDKRGNNKINTMNDEQAIPIYEVNFFIQKDNLAKKEGFFTKCINFFRKEKDQTLSNINEPQQQQQYQQQKQVQQKPELKIKEQEDRIFSEIMAKCLNKQSANQNYPNTLFYAGKMKSNFGKSLTIDEMHKRFQNYRVLEQDHAYIQWIFPNKYQSNFNSSSSPLNEQEIELFLKEPLLANRYIISYEMMLDFYGMQIKNKITGEICRKPNYKERYEDAVYGHNVLRIRRILTSLSNMGFRRYAIELCRFIKKEIEEGDRPLRNRNGDYNYDWKMYGETQNEYDVKSLEKNCFQTRDQLSRVSVFFKQFENPIEE